MPLLSNDEVKNRLGNYNGWVVEKNQIVKEFKFKDFIASLDFINKIGAEAEKMNHHPDIFLHSYNKVKLTLSTHSEGGITDNDINLAKKIESYSG